MDLWTLSPDKEKLLNAAVAEYQRLQLLRQTNPKEYAAVIDAMMERLAEDSERLND